MATWMSSWEPANRVRNSAYRVYSMTTNETASRQSDEHDDASGEVFARWVKEAERHWRAGDYHWMAGYAKGERVLEVGCGAGYSTLALTQAADSILVLEPSVQCRAHTKQLLATAKLTTGPAFLNSSVHEIDDAVSGEINLFSPSIIVCWLMGSADETSVRPYAPQERRLSIHRKVGELASRLPSVSAVQIADRTAFPWQLKTLARKTLTNFHNSTTFIDLPFSCSDADARFRKLDELGWKKTAHRNSLGVAPCIGIAIAKRHS